MDVACPRWREEAEQVKIIREIHDDLAQHMDRRVTIEELAHRYLINPTTLKTVFKEVYGSSLAAHMKEHRMERAAALLRETDLSVAEIAGRWATRARANSLRPSRSSSGSCPRNTGGIDGS